MQILKGRAVPLGGPRAMTVHRTLPHRDRTLIGSWCFVDHFGPDDVSETGGMAVPRHPHTGLATVSWLFDGAITHRDSIGSHVLVGPSVVDVMRAGRGITHSEFTTNDTTTLHGVQLWFAQPDATRFSGPSFEVFEPETLHADGLQLRVGYGDLAVTAVRNHGEPARLRSASAITADLPLDLAELTLDPGTTARLDLDPTHEYGILVDRGPVEVNGTEAGERSLVLIEDASSTAEITAPNGGRVLLIGGEPLREDIVMWWNFVGRSHEEIAEFRSRYQHEMGSADGAADTGAVPRSGESPLFGEFPQNTPFPLPAPRLPNGRLRSRSRIPALRRKK